MPNLNVLAAWAQIIAVPLAIIAILVSVYLYHRGRQRKALACEFHPIVSPIEIKAGKALQGDIEIRYKGQAVENLFLVRARLKNVGNLPIRRTDVIEHVAFTFEPDTELLREPRVVHKKPENLQINWCFPQFGAESRPRVVELDFDLLNPGEELTAEFTCTGEIAIPKVTARIEGITEIELLDPEEMRLSKEVKEGFTLLAALLGTSLAAVLVNYFSHRLTLSVPDWLSTITLTILVVVGSVALIWAWVGDPLWQLMRYRKHKGKS